MIIAKNVSVAFNGKSTKKLKILNIIAIQYFYTYYCAIFNADFKEIFIFFL